MARDTRLYSLAHAAAMIGENPALVEVVAANPDNIDYGEMRRVSPRPVRPIRMRKLLQSRRI
ncbi:MAG: hypothetical protein OJJ21_02755 [Ferrovibrio sp.]|uniref:hypothetical protein n=1 Tax=Ferrovibrio sp. TaxID=1917215 RepID=UPI0026130B87|nr:hypothetical protein [Ferrovibrio sp.]MCW0232499.1 hypothetical protein [Ferrovibrio sp.]